MADVSANETYTSVPRPGETRIYTWDLATGTNVLSDVALPVDAGGANWVYITIKDAGNAASYTIKPVGYTTLATASGSGQTINSIGGFIITGTQSSPCVCRIAPRYIAPTLTAVTSTAGTTTIQVEINY
jgi:hypothetical protein